MTVLEEGLAEKKKTFNKGYQWYQQFFIFKYDFISSNFCTMSIYHSSYTFKIIVKTLGENETNVKIPGT